MFTVDAFECGPVATMTYLVTNPRTNQAFVVDTPPDSHDVLLQAAKERACTITDILLTHTHWDHTADCSPLVKSTSAKVWVHSQDAYRLVDPMRHTIWPLPFTIERVVADHLLEGGERLTIAGLDLEVYHTPGHTEGGICFVDRLHKRVFVGDTLFRGSVGRTDLPGGDMEILVNSIRHQLYTLPDDFMAYPGHGPLTTIGDEKRTNPFVGEAAR